MMKYKLYIGGMLLVFVLWVSGMVVEKFYLERSEVLNDRCINHASDTATAEALCSHSTSAADAAFSWATASHNGSYLAIFFLFLLLVSKLEKLEVKVKQLEEQINV